MKEAMKLALEALEYIDRQDNDRDFLGPEECCDLDNAIIALREALAEQPAQQEPVAFIKGRGWRNGNLEVIPAKMNQTFEIDQPLYTSPPAQRKPLTDEQIYSVLENLQVMHHRPPTTDSRIVFARAIEAAHNIKENT